MYSPQAARLQRALSFINGTLPFGRTNVLVVRVVNCVAFFVDQETPGTRHPDKFPRKMDVQTLLNRVFFMCVVSPNSDLTY
jgi:hypothetical protein